MSRVIRVVVGLSLAGALVAMPRAATAAEETTFGLAISVAREDGKRVVDDAWVQSQIETANGFFVPLGVSVRWVVETELREPHGALHSRADRDALASFLEPRLINVFIVRELEDVDEPGRMRMGVCWTSRPDNKRLVVVSRTARPQVLAHELGHFFGNHQHSDVVNNLMSYARDDSGVVFLNDRQKAIITSFARSALANSQLLDVGPPRRMR